MVNPGAFRGSRKDFLISQKAAYAEAVVGGFPSDALAEIQRKYFKRYPVDLPHEEEPSQEHLSSVDDDAPDPETEEPDAEKMTEEEYQAAIKAIQARAEIVRFRKAQIKRWMSYQYIKDHDADPLEPNANNPYTSLIAQLTGKEPGRPRKKTAVNVWRKSQRQIIELRVKDLAEAQNIPKDRLAALRDKVAREMFNALPPSVQETWKKQAEEESKVASKDWERSLKFEPSTKPADRQLCIQGLVRVSQPFLDMLNKATGWNATLIIGGPEPAHGGQLNMISVHSGLTSGEVKMNFGRAERADYKKYVVPIFGRFLKKCFSPEECRARALEDDDGFVPLQEAELEVNGATFDALEELGTPDLQQPGQENSSQTPQHQDRDNVDDDAGTSSNPPPPDVTAVADSRPSDSSSSVARSTSSQEQSPEPAPTCPTESSPSCDTAPTSAPPEAATSAPTEATPHAAPDQPRTPPRSPRGCSPCHSPPATPRLSPRATPPLSPQASPPLSPQANMSLSPRAPSPSPAHTLSSRSSPSAAPRCASPPSASSTYPTPPTEMDPDITTRASSAKRRPRSPSSSSPSAPPPSKRPRTSQDSHSTSLALSSATKTPISSPAGSPKWFDDALLMLQARDLGPHWRKLLETWVDFEVHAKFRELGKLGSQHRPSCIGDWIQRRRSPTWRPTIDLADMENKFTKWWASLQPEWRLNAQGKVDFLAVDGQWETLRKPGANGLYSVVVALFYWGIHAGKGSVEYNRWLKAMKDVQLAFECLEKEARLSGG